MATGTPVDWPGSGHLVTSPQGQGMWGVWQESCWCAQHREWEMFLLEGQDTCPGPVSERLWLLAKTMALRAQQGAGCPCPAGSRRAAGSQGRHSGHLPGG